MVAKYLYFAWGLDSLSAKDYFVCTNHVLPSSAKEAADKIGQLVYFGDAV